MKILITGSNGFIGKNLVENLKVNKEFELLFCEKETTDEELNVLLLQADFIYHLAGVNRTTNVEEFYEGNSGLTTKIINILETNNKNTPILLSSSIQADLDNDYGKSKNGSEVAVLEYGKKNNATTYIYRLPNIFGKWCKPNYNSFITTMCYNIANNIPVSIDDENKVLQLGYIDTVVKDFVSCLYDKQNTGFKVLSEIFEKKLGEIFTLITTFNETRLNIRIPDFSDKFTKYLYSTYLTYLPEKNFIYDIKSNVDNRGSFTEILKNTTFGQMSVNVSKPGITKGQHWHNTKVEKFLVVSGEGLIQLRKIGRNPETNTEFPVLDFVVSGTKFQIIEMIPGYTHNIINLSKTEDLVTLMWCNESYDPESPDTFYEEV